MSKKINSAITVAFEQEIIRQIKLIAKEMSCSSSVIVRQAVKKFIQEYNFTK